MWKSHTLQLFRLNTLLIPFPMACIRNRKTWIKSKSLQNGYILSLLYNPHNLLAPPLRGINMLPLFQIWATVRVVSLNAFAKRWGNFIARLACPYLVSCQNKVPLPLPTILIIPNPSKGANNQEHTCRVNHQYLSDEKHTNHAYKQFPETQNTNIHQNTHRCQHKGSPRKPGRLDIWLDIMTPSLWPQLPMPTIPSISPFIPILHMPVYANN